MKIFIDHMAKSKLKAAVITHNRLFLLLFFVSFLFLNIQCSLTETRPIQLMAETSAAIQAAREVQAERLSPELFRQANEHFLKARNHDR
jgi:hypothetical protein